MKLELSSEEQTNLIRAIDGAKYDREWYFSSGTDFINYLNSWIQLFDTARQQSMGIVITL